MERCKNGHELTAENTRVYERKKGPRAGKLERRCTNCQHEAQTRYHEGGGAAAAARTRRRRVDRAAPQPICKCGSGKPALPSTRSGPGATGRCTDCHVQIVRRWQQNNPDKHKEATNRRRRALVDGFIDAYEGACECCGETIRRFLTLDHANDDGGVEIATPSAREPAPSCGRSGVPGGPDSRSAL